MAIMCVNCVEADDVEYMEVGLQEHRKDNEPGEIKRLKSQKRANPQRKYPTARVWIAF